MIYAISCLSMKRHSAIFTFPSLAKLAVSLRAWTQLSILRNATPTDVISQYDYTYDAAGRRIEIARSGSAMSESRTDAYGYNVRNELTSATKTGGPASVPATLEYAYQYDDIGNRITSTDLGTNRTYTANSLNQYTLVGRAVPGAPQGEVEEFVPQFDDDGNQTLIQTSTGIWQVQYNGENRPVLWTGGTQSAATNIVMSFDRMGRRITKNNQWFVYNGYLQIANFEHSFTNSQLFIWDPTEPIATRPLVWYYDASAAYYTHDGNKNVSEIVASDGDVSAHYEYAPFGAVIARRGTFATNNPWRFSSEHVEDETATVYYNYRHYGLTVGRWLCLDPAYELAFFKIQSPKRVNHKSSSYQFLYNQLQNGTDYIGLSLRRPCGACDSLRCRTGCSKKAAFKGFKTSFPECEQYLFRVECTCYGVCELVLEVKPAFEGARYSCMYKCGHFGMQAKDSYAPCKQAQLWRLGK